MDSRRATTYLPSPAAKRQAVGASTAQETSAAKTAENAVEPLHNSKSINLKSRIHVSNFKY